MSVVNFELHGDVGVITMDDGKANAMNPTMIEAVNAALDEAEAKAKAVVLAGREKVLCGGFDLKIIRGGDPELARTMSLGGAKLMMRLYGYPRPLVITTGGHCVALGGFMLLTGDYRIGVSGDFRIGLNEVAIAMTLPPFGMMLAKERIATRHLQNATTNATLFTPDEAVEVGFLDETVNPGELQERTMVRANELAQLDNAAFVHTKLAWRGADVKRILGMLPG